MRAIITSILLTTTCIFAFDSTIPVLDLDDYKNPETKEQFLNDLGAAMRDVGFFGLENLGVDPQVLDDAYAAMEAFFASPWEKKIELDGLDVNYQRGFIPAENPKENLNKIDYKEMLHIGPEDYLPNKWPEWQPDFQEHMMGVYNALNDCANLVLEAFAEVYDLPIDTFTEMVKGGDNLMRPIFYPTGGSSDTIWAGAHTDIDLCTFLPRSTAKGLQVMTEEGEWKYVMVPDGAVIVNVGDMLENVTNGLCKSAYHRVLDPGENIDRYTIVHFMHPRPEVRLDPRENCIAKSGGVRKYANITRQELLIERLIDIGFANREAMEWFVETGAVERLREVGRFSQSAETRLVEAGLL